MQIQHGRLVSVNILAIVQTPQGTMISGYSCSSYKINGIEKVEPDVL